MPVDPGIAMSAHGMGQMVNPLDIMQGIQQSQLHRQQLANERLANEQHTFALKEAQQKAEEDDRYKAAIASSVGMTPDQLLEHIRTNAPGSYIPVQKAIQDAQEKAALAKKATEDAASAHSQAMLHQQAYIGHLAGQIHESDYNPIVLNAALNEAVQQFPEWKGHADQIRQIAAEGGKEAVKAALAPLRSVEDDKSRAETLNANATRPKLTADAAVAAQVAAGTVGGLTPEQQAAGRRADTTAQEAARHNRAEEGFQRTTQVREQAKFDATYAQGKDENGKPVISPMAKAIAEYKQPGFSGRAAATGLGKIVMDQVLTVNPSYDATQFPTRNKMRIAFTSGSQSQTLNSLNTAIEHLDQFATFAKGLENGDVQVVNSFKNWLKANAGSSAPTNFDGAKNFLSGEVATAMKKSGATDTEIAKAQASMDRSNSPTQLMDYVTKVAIPMIGSKAHTFDAQWKQTMGDKDPFSVYTPGAKAVLDKYSGSHDTAAVPPAVSDTLKGAKDGHYTLTDGTKWTVKGGVVSKD